MSKMKIFGRTEPQPSGGKPRALQTLRAARPRLALLCGVLFALALSGWLGAGCASEKPAAPAVLASVEIQDRAPVDIADAAIAVLRAHGYEVARHGKRNLVFEKPGSGMSRFAYGDWVSGNSVWERVTVTMVPEGGTATRLDCDAHLIKNKGEALEEPVKYGHVSRKPLQQMLDEIAARLRMLSEPPPQP